MKEMYNVPKMEVAEFDVEDIITTSAIEPDDATQGSDEADL